MAANREGAAAYEHVPEYRLLSLMLTSFVEDQFYRSAQDTLLDLKGLIREVGPLFAAKATSYVRNEHGMRSITHAATCEIVRLVSEETHQKPGEGRGPEWTKAFVADTIRRVDDAQEMVAYWLHTYGKPLPHALLKGIRLSLQDRGRYQLAKYRGEGKEVNLTDLMRLTHPSPTNGESRQAWEDLTYGRLSAAGETWEAMLTQAGQDADGEEDKAARKAEVWRTLIVDERLPYFALLRNLRNIAQQARDALPMALEQLRNPDSIRKSLVLPFRFITAADTLAGADLDASALREIRLALDAAIEVSLENVPYLSGRTCVALDDSGSMVSRLRKGAATPAEIGAGFAAVLVKVNNADLMLFSDTARYVTVNNQDSTLSIIEQIRHRYRGAGTNHHAPFELAEKQRTAYDRFVVLSDEQGWMPHGYLRYYGMGNPKEVLEAYKRSAGVDPFVYSFDLQGYGTTMFQGEKIFLLSGWSSETLKIMSTLEGDRNALIKQVDEYRSWR
jgi:hypothetical protein